MVHDIDLTYDFFSYLCSTGFTNTSTYIAPNYLDPIYTKSYTLPKGVAKFDEIQRGT